MIRLYRLHETACFDPLTLAAIGAGVGGLAGVGTAVASALTPTPKVPTIPPAAPPVQSPTGTQTSNAANTSGPSFLAAAAQPTSSQTSGSKTLLGQ